MSEARRNVLLALVAGAFVGWFLTSSWYFNQQAERHDLLKYVQVNLCSEVEEQMIVKQGYVYPEALDFFCGWTDAAGRRHPPGEYTDVDGKIRVHSDFP